MADFVIGIDNGVTGSICVLHANGAVARYLPTPVKKCLNYTKTKAWIHRIDFQKMLEFLSSYKGFTVRCVIERPMVNPGRFKATVSALRCLEATEILLEQLSFPYEWIDSREWQRVMLPDGLEKEELKKASDEVCHRLFPELHLKSSGMGDSALIAEYSRRKLLGR